MNIAVFFGGRSCEHDISIITGVQVLNALGDGYRVLPVYMKDGGFYTSDLMLDVGFFENPNLKKATRIWLIDGSFYTRKGMLLLKKETPDVALICCHGGEGENGVLQGFLEYNGVPYTSAGLIASSVCMDKSIAKQLLDGLMLNTMPSITVHRSDFEKNTNDVIRHVSTFLEYPLIVKPSGLGSSIGIKKARTEDELKAAIEVAAKFDEKIIVENALENFKELNCAAYSDGRNVYVSEVESPVSWHDFLSFDDKYSGGKNGGGKRELPANIPSEIRDNVKGITKRIYEDLDMSGVVRVDFLLSDDQKLFVNEVNTVPGSMAFYLFEPVGISFRTMLDGIIAAALIRKKEARKDKSIAKQLLDGLMLNTMPSITVHRSDFEKNTNDVIRHVSTFLEYPLIVKPSGLGSSIGIKKARTEDELKAAIEVAAKFDEKIIVENALENFKELNCAAYSDGRNVYVSEVESPVSWHDFLSFDDKYSGGKNGGGKRELPANIPSEIRDNVKGITKRIYEDLDMSGVVRVDFLLSDDQKLFVNEVNTVPGSMAFYLFEPVGISFRTMLDGIIAAALIRKKEARKSRLYFDSDVIRNFMRGKSPKHLQK